MRRATVMATGALLLAGCGGDRRADSPEAAVERFLDVWADRPEVQGSGEATDAVKRFWARACQAVDPAIRPRLRKEAGAETGDAGCGGMVVFLVAFTGDTPQMQPPDEISGSVVSADTTGESSIVTVELRYSSKPIEGSDAKPPPPDRVTVRVLVVRRAGAWWVATPQAFNPLAASQGAPSPARLRSYHRELLSN